MSAVQSQYHPLASPTQQGSVLDKKISEACYWTDFYEKQIDENGNPVSYEWNNGYLEVKPVSDQFTSVMYAWFLKLLDQYLHHYPIAHITLLEMGGRFRLSEQELVIRKPDLGIVLNSNPTSLNEDDRRYQGCHDMCIEALSDSTLAEITRDTVQKKREYQQAGVKEYLILARNPALSAYYHLNDRGVYEAVRPDGDGIVRSQILPGFQWHVTDLYQQPDWEQMITMSAYKGFVSLAYQREQQARIAAETARIAAETARIAAETARQQAESEKNQADLAQQQAELERDQAQQSQQLLEQQLKQAQVELARLRASIKSGE